MGPGDKHRDDPRWEPLGERDATFTKGAATPSPRTTLRPDPVRIIELPEEWVHYSIPKPGGRAISNYS